MSEAPVSFFESIATEAEVQRSVAEAREEDPYPEFKTKVRGNTPVLEDGNRRVAMAALLCVHARSRRIGSFLGRPAGFPLEPRRNFPVLAPAAFAVIRSTCHRPVLRSWSRHRYRSCQGW